jgi:hypothetical protein
VTAYPALPTHPFPIRSTFRSARRIARALVAGAALAAAVATFPARALAQEAAAPSVVEVFDSTVADMRAQFFDPSAFTAHFDTSASDRRTSLVATATPDRLQSQIRALLQELRCSGSRFYPEGQAPDFTPAFTWRETLDGMVVRAVQPGSACERAGMLRGDYLLTPVSDLWGPLGSVATLRVRTSDGAEWSQPVKRDGYVSSDPDLGLGSYLGKIGYLRVTRLHDPAVVDTAMQHVRGFQSLILDVRGCSDADVSVLRLLSYFARAAGPAGFAANRAGLTAQGGSAITRLPAGTARNTGDAGAFHPDLAEKGLLELGVVPVVGDSAYTGRVVLLADEGTAGFAELVPAWFLSTKRALVVGRTTAGRGGLPATLRTAAGWTLELPTAALFLPDGRPLEPQGVEPQRRIKWRQVDVRSGADPDVERAIQALDVDVEP